MPATGFSLAQAIQAIGVARCFIGDPFTAGGLIALPTEGPIQVGTGQNMNMLTAPEMTGDVPHDAWITPTGGPVTVPVIYGDDELWEALSAHGAADEGFTAPQRPVYTSLVIFPLLEMDTSVDPPTISYNSVTGGWDPGAPVHALWFWKVVPIRPEFSLAWENGGKVIIPVQFQPFFAGSAGDYAGIPNGQKIFSRGNPVAKGVTGLAI